MDNIQEKPQWYILQTLSGYEKMVYTNLNNMVENNNLGEFIFDVAVPEIEEITEKNDKKKVTLRRRFPCYVFIKMIYTKHVWYMVTQTRGVTCFCGPQGRPLSMSDEEVKRMQLEMITADDIDITVGDQVEVLAGPLKGIIGLVSEINFGSQKFKVIVRMFGKETPTDLNFVDVRRIKL